jgi:HEAT repeat protein
MRMGDECQLGKEWAENLHAQSRSLRGVFSEVSNPAAVAARKAGKPLAAVPAAGDDPRMDAVALRESFATREELKRDFQSTAGIPALMQMLTPESTAVRKVLVDQLGGVDHNSSTEALVKLALFDINDEVRTKAVQALAERPREDTRKALLQGFRYPWAPVADHAAEALVALRDRDAVPALNQLVALPDPSAPYYDDHKQLMVKEVVRVNHMRNCLMCHAPSASTNDLLRARVPEPGKPVPPPFSVAYYNSDGSRTDPSRVHWVRADVTYLRQDFSVPQPVEKADPWPTMQRYDYLVRTRPANATDVEWRAVRKQETYPQREAVQYALRELQRE